MKRKRTAVLAGVVLVVLGIGSTALAVEPVQQAMACRASAARVALSPSAILEPTVANAALVPCLNDTEQLAVIPIGTLAVVEGLGASTEADLVGQPLESVTAIAQARVATAILFLPGATVVVSGAFSQVEDRCSITDAGLVHKVTQTSHIARIQIGSTVLTGVDTPQTLTVGAVKIHLNQSLPFVQRAVAVEINGAPVITLAEAVAGLLFPCGR